MDTKFVALSEHLKGEDALLGGQIEPASLIEAVNEERAEYLAQAGAIIAFVAWWPRHESSELGSFWVDPRKRGRGLGSLIFARLVARKPRGPVFLITHNARVVHLARKNSFREASAGNWTATIPWGASCGPCDRIGESGKATCPFRGVPAECRLFFR